MSRETAESVHVTSNSYTVASDANRKDLTAQTAGRYAPGYAEMVQNRHSDINSKIDDVEHVNINGNQNVKENDVKGAVFPRKLRTEHGNIDKNVGESSASKRNSSVPASKIKAPPEQNKSNVVLLNGSPYVLVPYKSLKSNCDKASLLHANLTYENEHYHDYQLTDNASVDNEISLSNLSEQLRHPASTSRIDDHLPYLPIQSGNQTRPHIQSGITGCKNAPTATTVKVLDENARSYELEPRVSKLQMNKQHKSLQSTFISNIAGICGQSDMTTEPGKENAEENLVRSDNVAIDGSAGIRQHVTMTTTLLHREHSTSSKIVQE